MREDGCHYDSPCIPPCGPFLTHAFIRTCTRPPVLHHLFALEVDYLSQFGPNPDQPCKDLHMVDKSLWNVIYHHVSEKRRCPLTCLG